MVSAQEENDMSRLIEGKLEGAQIFRENVTLVGMIVGNVVVEGPGALELLGMVVGNVTVRTGGKLSLKGTVTGDLSNEGGEARVFGTISGALHKVGGQTVVDPRAAIGRVPYTFAAFCE